MDAILLNSLLGILAKKVIVPSTFQDQVGAVKLLQEDDVSGMVDSLTDFSVNSACVGYTIETKNEELTKTYKKWLDTINISYNGLVPVGINELAKEYFKERWKYSSFCVLKILKWEPVNGILLPTKMAIVDGESIYAEDKDEDGKTLNLVNYDYFIGQDKKIKLDDDIIFSRPYSRWFDKYTIPYLIKRGVYHNWKIIESLKNNQTKILEQIIPYLLLIKKGTDALATNNIKTYTPEELKDTISQFQALMDEMKSTEIDGLKVKAPIRATMYDEEIKHLIPDLKTIFDPVLFAQAERNILSGLGFIDVIQGISDTRRESILNPKVFISEIKSGVHDFEQIINQLLYLIKEKNTGAHRKYVNYETRIITSPISIFQTDEFKNQMRLLWERGLLSNQTYCEIVGEVKYKTEVIRREKEAEEGHEYTMYPHLTKNVEDKGIDIYAKDPKDKEDDKNGKPIPQDKITDKDKYDIGKKDKDLEIAPYQKITDLPIKIKKVLSKDLQSVFLKVFNNAYRTYENDSRAFRVAWSVIRKIAKKNKQGIWIRKTKKEGKITKKVKLDRAMLENILEKEEADIIKEAMDSKDLEIKTKQSQLLDKLLEKNKG